jgi:hypothetical protein
MCACRSGREGLGRQCSYPGSGHEGGCEASAHMRAVVLRPRVTRADGGGSLWWPELMVEVACAVYGVDGGGGVHAYGWGPTHVSLRLMSLELV